VASLWTVVIVAVSGLAGVAVGVGAGVLIARRNNERLFQSMRKVRSQERRAAMYLEVAARCATDDGRLHKGSGLLA
jgi:hypothetical protein